MKEIGTTNDAISEKAVKALEALGEAAGVGKDWYEIGEEETGEDGEVIHGVYAKTDEIGDKVMPVLLDAVDRAMKCEEKKAKL